MKEIDRVIELWPHFKIPANEKSMHADVHSVDPIKFRTTTDDDESIEVKIDNVARRDAIQIGKETVFKYICNITLYGRKTQCEIWYNVNTMKWTLKRI